MSQSTRHDRRRRGLVFFREQALNTMHEPSYVCCIAGRPLLMITMARMPASLGNRWSTFV